MENGAGAGGWLGSGVRDIVLDLLPRDVQDDDSAPEAEEDSARERGV